MTTVERAKAYLNSTFPDERDWVGFDGEGYANDEDAAQLIEAGWEPCPEVTCGPCPLCGEPMEYGDEFPEERCCIICAS